MRRYAAVLSVLALSAPVYAQESTEEVTAESFIEEVLAYVGPALAAELAVLLATEGQPWSLELCTDDTCMMYDSAEGYSSWPAPEEPEL